MKYTILCNECSKIVYPNVDKSKLTGITLFMGKCDRCEKEEMVIPVRDLLYASGYSLYWD